MANKVKDINMAYDMVRSLWQNMSMARYCLPLAVELWHMHATANGNVEQLKYLSRTRYS